MPGSDLRPLISVIIPAYNQADYLAAAVQSALEQTYSNLEVIVVDDGSTDETPKIAQSFTDPRVRYIHQENRGLSGARNTGIRNARGDFLTYLDSDDLFLPNKLSTLAQVFESSPEIGFAAGQAIPIDETDHQLGNIFDTPLPKDPSRLLLGNPLHVGSVLLRRKWQEEVGYFDESLRSYEDWDMWLRFGLAGCKMAWVNEPVSLYRFHTAQMTRIGTQMTTATFAVLDKFFDNPDLPETWLQHKDQAYSNAHLRACAQAYLAENYTQAKEHLLTAVQLNPALAEDRGRELSVRFAAWINLPKTQTPLKFLENIYQNPPDELEGLRRRHKHEIGAAAIRRAFQAYQRGESEITRASIMTGLRYQPRNMFNRGVWSIFIRSFFSNSPADLSQT